MIRGEWQWFQKARSIIYVWNYRFKGTVSISSIWRSMGNTYAMPFCTCNGSSDHQCFFNMWGVDRVERLFWRWPQWSRRRWRGNIIWWGRKFHGRFLILTSWHPSSENDLRGCLQESKEMKSREEEINNSKCLKWIWTFIFSKDTTAQRCKSIIKIK